MSGFKGVIKDGWHPKGKDGGKESWRGDFKGINQVAGWMGKGKKPGEGGSSGSEHMSRPLATLKDPSLFGPPPKNVNYHGGIALPNEVTPHRGGLGAPLTQAEIETARETVQQQEQQESAQQITEDEAAKRSGPPLPYRANTTGLKTDHLPPPPVHRAVAESSSIESTQASTKPKPHLPPRLPSRQNSGLTNGSSTSLPSVQPPTYETAVVQPVQQPQQPPAQTNSWLNQNAANRLGKAGVAVPALGIGESNPWKSEQSQSASPSPVATGASGMNELQSRFARMNSGTPTSPQSPPAEGTTFEQKQAAFKTAQNFHKDPSSVSMADAQSAASTVNNFRARHQDQIAAGAQKANGWNKKYNVTGRVNSFLEKQASPVAEQPQPEISAPISSPPLGNINRKPPPPPPPKKPSALHAPPPVPIGTKPSFS